MNFVNEPKHIVNPVRDIILFENPILEAGTKTPWYGIPIAFSTLLYYYYIHANNEWLEFIALTALGIFMWTLEEYLLHRFVFHAEEYWLPNSKYAAPFHFLAHGIHHSFP